MRFNLITQSVDSQLLVEELQLGEQLNQCVHNNRRSDFTLMLSMLTEDIRAHSQFKLPKTVQPATQTTDETLRKRLELPAKERLALDNLSAIDEFAQASLVQAQQFEMLHLMQALKPKPLAFRDDKSFIAADVISNTSLYCQQQYKKQDAEEEERLSFNVNEWLKTVQTTIVKSPLISESA